MTGIIERLYRNTTKEVNAGLIVQERYLQNSVGVPAAATSIALAFPAVPIGFVRIITSFGVVSAPGAAQTTLGGVFQVAVPGLGAIYQHGFAPNFTPVAAVANYMGITLGEGVMLRNGDVVSVTVFFNAGAANNNANAFLNGYQFPVGNLL